MCACTEGFVQALAAEACVFGNLRHAARFGYIAERGDEYLGIRVFGSRRKIFRNHRIVIEIRRRVEWFVSCFLSSSLSPSGLRPLEFASHFFRFGNILRLRGFYSTSQQNINGRSGSRVINAISRPDMNPHLGNAFADGFRNRRNSQMSRSSGEPGFSPLPSGRPDGRATYRNPTIAAEYSSVSLLYPSGYFLATRAATLRFLKVGCHIRRHVGIYPAATASSRASVSG